MDAVGGEGDKILFDAKLDLIILNPEEEVKEMEENVEVIENYYRVKTAEIMEEARKLSEKNKFKEA